MEWNEWNDGDADDPEATHNRDYEPWPPAPLPPHERTWRHPSELGATTVHVVAPAQAGLSRKATAATVAVGVLLVAGAVRLMVPNGASRGNSEVAASLSIVTTSFGAVTTPVDSSAAGPAPTATPAPTFTSLRVTTTAPASTAGGEALPTAPPVEFTMLRVGTPTYAVVLDSGRFLATSAAAVSGMDTVQVQLPSGDTAQATVIPAGGPIALLDLAAPAAAPAPHGEPPDAGETVTVSSPSGFVEAIVGEGNEDGYRLLTSDEPLHESGPVFDADGVVVGICTKAHEQAWLVPVLMLDDLAAQQPEPPPVTSTSTTVATSTTSTSSTTTTSTTVPPTSTTSTTSTSTTSTTSSTTSTTRPPATAAPSTTG